MPGEGKWDAVVQLLRFLGLLVIVGLIYGIGSGKLNVDFVLRFSKDAIELLRTAR